MLIAWGDLQSHKCLISGGFIPSLEEVNHIIISAVDQ